MTESDAESDGADEEEAQNQYGGGHQDIDATEQTERMLDDGSADEHQESGDEDETTGESSADGDDGSGDDG